MEGTYYIYSRPRKGCRWAMIDKASTRDEAREKVACTARSVNRPGFQVKAVDAMTGRMVRNSLFTQEEA